MGKLIGTNQFAELAAAVIRNLPRDINPYSAQYWIVNQEELEARLKTALIVAEYEEPVLPAELTVCGVTYELIEFVGERPLDDAALIARAREIRAISSEEEAMAIFSMAWLREVPAALRRAVIVFSDWRNCPGGSRVACLACVSDAWGVTFVPLDQLRGRLCRMLRRKVEKSAEQELPIEITVGGVTYEILSFLRENERYVKGDVMVERAKEMNANLGEEDGQHFLKHRGDIPDILQKEIVFVFTGWCHPGDRERVTYLVWDRVDWFRSCKCLSDGWSGEYRLLRRKAA